MERECYLYLIVDRQDRTRNYVGITIHPTRRWSQHKAKANSDSQTYLHRALRKYGVDRFEWKVIARYRTEQIARTMERVARKLGIGSMNMTDGGEGCLNPSAHTRSKIASHFIGKPRSPESIAKQKATLAARMTPERREVYRIAATGRVCSDQTKAKIAEANKGKPKSEQHVQKICAAAKARSATAEGISHLKKASSTQAAKDHREWLAKARKGKPLKQLKSLLLEVTDRIE